MACTVAFKPIDPKRDEFRRYLERAGVIEALTKVVIRIVKERPENPLEYLRTNLCNAKHETDEYAYLQQELEEARHEIKRLREVIAAADPDALKDEKSTTATTTKTSNETKKPVEESSTKPQENTTAKETKEENAENAKDEHEIVEKSESDATTKEAEEN